MRYVKDDVVVNAVGGWRVLENLGYKSEVMLEYHRKKEDALSAFRQRAAERWSCPECGKEMSALAKNKHHASHQEGR